MHCGEPLAVRYRRISRVVRSNTVAAVPDAGLLMQLAGIPTPPHAPRTGEASTT